MTADATPTEAAMDGWTEEFDVVVVGSGGGALAGAYTAGTHGLRTVVLEKTALFGGMTAYSGAALWFPGNSVQLAGEPDDSVAEAREFLFAVFGESTRAHVETYLETGPELVEFLSAHPDVDFRWNRFPDYFEAPGRRRLGRSIWPAPIDHERVGDLLPLLRPDLQHDRVGRPHPKETLIRGRAYIASLLLAGRSTGNVEYRVGSPMTELVLDDHGAVVGVVARQGEETVRIRARRGVLLAAGGYEGNARMRAATGTPGSADWTMAPAGANTGEPIALAVAAGAATDLMGDAWWAPGVEQPDGRAGALLCVSGGLMVDGRGERFCNESLPYDQLGRAMAGNATDGSTSGGTSRMPIHFVFDSRTGGKLPAVVQPEATTEEYLSCGAWVRADSIEELAEHLGVPVKALCRTVEEFNTGARTGVDERFHRGEDVYDLAFATHAGPNPALVPIEQGPFYAARMVIADLGTKGGLRIDTEGRVLRADGDAIPGLYAAGNTTASMTRHTYPGPGLPIGLSTLFSYRAANHMAARR